MKPEAWPRFQSLRSNSLLPFYTETIIQVYPVWCSRLHNHNLFIKKLCKKLGVRPNFGEVRTPLTPQRLRTRMKLKLNGNLEKTPCEHEKLSTVFVRRCWHEYIAANCSVGNIVCIIERYRFIVGINAILQRGCCVQEISSGRLAMLRLGPIRDFLGLIVDVDWRPIEPAWTDHPHSCPLETRRELWDVW